MEILTLTIAGMQIAAMLLTWVLCYKYVNLHKQKAHDEYTDYVHNNLILRIYKPEFEHLAIGSIPRDKLLDQGTLSYYYMWALIEK